MHPSISPYYENLEKYRGRLPNAFFTCGTEDPLLDDSVMMATKWMMAGAGAILKIYPGAPHGFIGFVDMLDEAKQALEDTKTFIQGQLEKA
jgi:acetyl esterase/lipase